MAETLERATEALWDQVEKDFATLDRAQVGDLTPPTVAAPAMMLAGLTIENLLKGVCIGKEPPLSNDGDFRLRTHKLLDLAARADLALGEDERGLLERLEVFIEWAGRYPIPLSYKDMLPRTLPTRGFAPLTYFRTSDIVLWRRLITRLCDEL